MIFSVGKNALIPHDIAARDRLAEYQIGELLDVDTLDDREAAFRRFVFAAITRTAQAAGRAPDEMRTSLLLDTGRFQMVRTASGKLVAVVKSMNRHSMPDKELRAFWADARDVIRQMLRSFDRNDADEIDAMLRGEDTRS